MAATGKLIRLFKKAGKPASKKGMKDALYGAGEESAEKSLDDVMAEIPEDASEKLEEFKAGGKEAKRYLEALRDQKMPPKRTK